jgi:hypothetical protein
MFVEAILVPFLSVTFNITLSEKNVEILCAIDIVV